MKCTVVIDGSREEEVLIYAHEPNDLTRKIAQLVQGTEAPLIGYTETAAVTLQASDIFCITIDGGKLYALTEGERLQMRRRLYELEQLLGRDFVKINQSCIVSTKRIARFEASRGGALMVVLKNGYRDYVSRRQLKAVKERMGL